MKPYYSQFPKTGTRSVLNTMDKKLVKSQGHIILKEAKIPENSKTFVTIREPLSYYISMYNYKVRSKDSGKNYGTMKNNSFNDFVNDYVKCNNLQKWEKPWKNNFRQKLILKYIQGKNLNIGYFTFLYIFYSYKDPETVLTQPNILEFLKNNKPDIDHIIRLEHLDNDYKQLVLNNDFPLVENWKHLNQSKKLFRINKNDYSHLKIYDQHIYENFYS